MMIDSTLNVKRYTILQFGNNAIVKYHDNRNSVSDVIALSAQYIHDSEWLWER